MVYIYSGYLWQTDFNICHVLQAGFSPRFCYLKSYRCFALTLSPMIFQKLINSYSKIFFYRFYRERSLDYERYITKTNEELKNRKISLETKTKEFRITMWQQSSCKLMNFGQSQYKWTVNKGNRNTSLQKDTENSKDRTSKQLASLK